MSHLRKVLADYLSMRRALGYKMDQVERRLRQFIAFAEDHGETHVRTVTALGFSASGIREMVASGRSPRYLLPDAVLEYISQQALYQNLS